MSASTLTIVSADGHCGARPATYRDYIDPRYRSAIDELIEEDARRTRQVTRMLEIPDEVLSVIDLREAIRTGGTDAAWDPERRLRELDAEGVAAEILYPNQHRALMPFFTVTNRVANRELRAAGARAYHRWLADYLADSPGRLYGVLDPFVGEGVDATVAEVEWAAGRGFVALMLPGAVVDDDATPPLWDPVYEPLWAVCEEAGIVLTVHAGHGHRQGELSASMDRMSALGLTRHEVMSRMHDGDNPLHRPADLSPRAPLWQLMLADVFDEHPGLRFSMAEVHADWIGDTLAALDERFERGGTSLRRRPSEYWAEHCAVVASSPRRCDIEARGRLGVTTLQFGTDFVQPESTWPNTRAWLREGLRGVPESEVRSFLGSNALSFYRLDAERISEVAARIGVTPSEILSDRPVDPELIADFDLRAGFQMAAEVVDRSAVVAAFDDDLAARCHQEHRTQP